MNAILITFPDPKRKPGYIAEREPFDKHYLLTYNHLGNVTNTNSSEKKDRS